MKLNKKRTALAAAASTALFATIITTAVLMNPNRSMQQSGAAIEVPMLKEPIMMKYGFILNDYDVTEDVINPNQSLSEILGNYHVTGAQLDDMKEKAKDVFNFNKIVAGKEYTVLAEQNTGNIQYFIYEPSPYYYIVCDFTNPAGIQVKRVDREVQLVEKSITGIIHTSLWDAINQGGPGDYMLAVKMEEALKYSVDFFHIKPGDRFKLIYTEKWVEGKQVGIDELKAAYVKFGNDEAYSFLFKGEDDESACYYDENARPQKKAFLKSPVEFARISSRFNLHRYHPVLHYIRPHLGTDFAAPTGTPILAVADGIVETASRSGGNGIFVKIRHDNVFESQYLHMSRHAKGISAGTRVHQGQVIGYVGSTGLATGPHCCFRFWKNGQQVDFLNQKLPHPQPITGPKAEKFFAVRDELKSIIDKMTYPDEVENKATASKDTTNSSYLP